MVLYLYSNQLDMALLIEMSTQELQVHAVYSYSIIIACALRVRARVRVRVRVGACVRACVCVKIIITA